MSRADFERHFPLRKPPVWGGPGSVERSITAGDVDAVRSAINEGIDVNEQDEYGQTLLIIAAAVRSSEMVRLLLGAGADPNILSDDGGGPLTCAVADIGRPGWFWQLPVNLEVIAMLLEAGANPNARDSYGRSPAERVRRSLRVRRLFRAKGYKGDFL